MVTTFHMCSIWAHVQFPPQSFGDVSFLQYGIRSEVFLLSLRRCFGPLLSSLLKLQSTYARVRSSNATRREKSGGFNRFVMVSVGANAGAQCVGIDLFCMPPVPKSSSGSCVGLAQILACSWRRSKHTRRGKMGTCRPWCPPVLPSVSICWYTFFLFLMFFEPSIASAQPISSGSANATAVTDFTWSSEDLKTEKVISCLAGSSVSPAGAMCLTPLGPTFDLTSGRCIYKSPIQFSPMSTQSNRSFSTMFRFTTQKYPGLGPGQGFTFFIGPENTTLGDPGRYLGWLSSNTSAVQSLHNFAVEFDIFQDWQLNDTDNNHIGIDVNSLESQTVFSLWRNGLDLTTYDATDMLYAWIDYSGTTIEVRVSSEPSRPCSPVISSPLDLRNILLDTMYVGFTSSTGNDTDAQTTIFDWSFKVNGEATNMYGAAEHCGRSKLEVSWTVILGVVSGLLVIALVLFILLLYFRTATIKALQRNIAELEYLDYGAHEFTYKELLQATKRFSPKEILGEGASGTVYKGALSSARINKLKGEDASGDNALVAVKRINKKSAQGLKEYVAEVKVIGRLRHVNLVRLLGWCHQEGEMLLVYEYMPNGNLNDLMQRCNKSPDGAPGRRPLSWAERLEILRGVAAALVFLHEECEQRVVHRDVKSSNVMLDSDFHARLGDFGLARSHERKDHYHSTGVAGTIGYIAPECVVTGYASTKSDVYSFGALALEVATGRNPAQGEVGLVRWVWRLQSEGRVLEAVDASLNGDYNKDEMEKLLKVALFCCLPDPDARPSMRQVQTVLQGESPILSQPLPPAPMSGLSLKFIDSNDLTLSTTDMSITDWGSAYGSEDGFLSKAASRSSGIASNAKK